MIDEKKYERLHQKYSHGKYAALLKDICWTHCLIVKDIALDIASDLTKKYGIKIDTDLLEDGALVHDVGFYSCFDDNFQPIEEYYRHGYLGYGILKREGLGEILARFSLTHTGVGINREQILSRKMELPVDDYIPISLEEEIVSFADKFHSKSGPNFNSIEDQEKQILSKYPNDAIIFKRFVKKFKIPHLNKIKDEYNNWNQNSQIKLKKVYEDSKTKRL